MQSSDFYTRSYAASRVWKPHATRLQDGTQVNVSLVQGRWNDVGHVISIDSASTGQPVDWLQEQSVIRGVAEDGQICCHHVLDVGGAGVYLIDLCGVFPLLPPPPRQKTQAELDAEDKRWQENIQECQRRQAEEEEKYHKRLKAEKDAIDRWCHRQAARHAHNAAVREWNNGDYAWANELRRKAKEHLRLAGDDV